jgi:ribosomal protein S18 acetylase RimI-like enzyme
MILLLEIINNREGLILKPIQEYESDFGTSYKSQFVNTPHKFLEISIPVNTKAGEIEYGLVDDNTIEIISIHINKDHRGKGYGEQAIAEMFRRLKPAKIILKAAPSSRKFWRKLNFKPMQNVPNYFEKIKP